MSIQTPHGFPRTKRLLTPKDFREVFDDVIAKAACPELLILCKQRTPSKNTSSEKDSKTDASKSIGRIGFIISKKNIKHAVQRNRVKRIFRDNFRHLPDQMLNYDLIVMAKKGADKLTNEEIHKLAHKLLKKTTKRALQNKPSL
jgi:ribonuclease P protein component